MTNSLPSCRSRPHVQYVGVRSICGRRLASFDDFASCCDAFACCERYTQRSKWLAVPAKLLALVTFDSDTKVWQFDRYAFCESGLTSIHIPSSVQVICEGCFLGCQSLASVKHDPHSKLNPTLSALLTGRPLSFPPSVRL
jgi:hypothetical protein